MGLFTGLLSGWAFTERFNSLPADQRSIVVYATGRPDWPHLGPIVEHLTRALGRRICYVTSGADDPILSRDISGIASFYLKSDSARTIFRKGVKADVIVTSLPDIGAFNLRSVHPVHYIYVFHSIVSTHMVYRKSAFDAYDTVFCVGPHHVNEIRRTEALYALKPKNLVEHGYGRLDALVNAASPTSIPAGGPHKNVVIASSWGRGSLIEDPRAADLIAIVLSGGHHVTIRLHPMTVRRQPKIAEQLRATFNGRDLFRIETDMNEQDSLLRSDVMISDWSGAAFDYALGVERPVVFVDTPRKINNPEFERIDSAPLEVALRDEVGTVVHPRDLDSVLDAIQTLCADPTAHRARLRETRNRWVYNVGTSGSVGASHVARLTDSLLHG